MVTRRLLPPSPSERVLSKNPIDAVRRADSTLDARRVATFVTAESLCSARPVCRLFPKCCSSSSWPSRAGSTSSRVTSLTLSRKRIASAESSSVLAVSGSPTPSAAEQSCRSGRAAREDRHGEPAERRAVGVGGFRDPEHVVPRAPQPHDSSRVGVLAPALAMPRSWRRPAPRARRAPAVLLQFHSAAPGVEVRARDQDAGDAGRSGEPALGVARHLHGGRSHATYLCGRRARVRDRPAHGI